MASKEMPVPTNLVFPDDVAKQLLAQSNLNEDDAFSIIRRTCLDPALISKIGFCASTQVSVQIQPALGKQGDCSYTTFVTIFCASDKKELVSQFRSPADKASDNVLQRALSIFNDFVAMPLCLINEGPLQLLVAYNYGNTYEQQSHAFDLEQKRNAIRDYGTFLAMGRTQVDADYEAVSRVTTRFQEIATWQFPPTLSQRIQSLVGNLGISSSFIPGLFF
jgi:hypothetical protein